jgi:ferredoxin-NADP reductase
MRHRRRTRPDAAMRLLYSVRGGEDLIYADELGDEAVLTFSRDAPAGWTGHTGRIDPELVAATAPDGATAFVCGSNGFVEAAVALLLESGIDPGRVRTERFGPTG